MATSEAVPLFKVGQIVTTIIGGPSRMVISAVAGTTSCTCEYWSWQNNSTWVLETVTLLQAALVLVATPVSASPTKT